MGNRRDSKNLFTKGRTALVAFGLSLALSGVAVALPELPLPKRHLPRPHAAAELSASTMAGGLVLVGGVFLLIRRYTRRAS